MTSPTRWEPIETAALLKHGLDHVTKRVDGLRDWIESRRVQSVAAAKCRLAAGQRPADAVEFMRAPIPRDTDHQVRQHRAMTGVRAPGIITASDGCGTSATTGLGRSAPVRDVGWREQ